MADQENRTLIPGTRAGRTPLARASKLTQAMMVLGAASALAGGFVVLAVTLPAGAAASGTSVVLRAMVVLLPIMALAALVAWYLARTVQRDVVTPVRRIRTTIEAVAEGNFEARTGLVRKDEIGRLAQALDDLLDERLAVLNRTARESEELNNSVIEIMQAVGEIATSKDLTVKVPVTENVTGAISDALNLLTEETGRVLRNVTAVSQDVAHATVAVKSQSDQASHAAAREQREVELAARELAAAAAALQAIAERARGCNTAAERAVATTGEAMLIVGNTVQGIVKSRDLIRETEKRIKRLGERSQEIGQAVGLIQSIAERTGILALNASMHAAAAGEAGRSFAVVADEVKRLSETAKEATSQIGRLVSAIQTETGDTVVAMNSAISQVVEISRLADDAGREMRRTQDETEKLAASVRDIARTSNDQAKVGAGLQERARIIQEASTETARQLSAQASETRKLVEYAKALLDEVSVFKVPLE